MPNRSLLPLALAAWLLPGVAAAQDKTFTLTIGGTPVGIEVGETVTVTLPDGSTTEASLTRNPFSSYRSDQFQFVHPSEFSVTKSDVGDGIVQHLLASALGTIVIVQEYRDIDPSSLVPLMLQEMTKDGVAAGATVSQQPATRLVPDGVTMSGVTATETGKSDVADYEILGHGKDGAGLLVITRVDRDNAAQDRTLIDKFWESFRLAAAQ